MTTQTELGTIRILRTMDELEAEREKAEQWAKEVFDFEPFTDEDVTLFDWYVLMTTLPAHEATSDPRTPEQIRMDDDYADLLATQESARY